MCMLVELHTQSQDRFVYTCNECKHHVETSLALHRGVGGSLGGEGWGIPRYLRGSSEVVLA